MNKIFNVSTNEALEIIGNMNYGDQATFINGAELIEKHGPLIDAEHATLGELDINYYKTKVSQVRSSFSAILLDDGRLVVTRTRLNSLSVRVSGGPSQISIEDHNLIVNDISKLNFNMFSKLKKLDGTNVAAISVVFSLFKHVNGVRVFKGYIPVKNCVLNTILTVHGDVAPRSQKINWNSHHVAISG